MKKINLIKGLWDDSHEKRTPQRFGRYAAMLILLLTLGVGQMWAGNYAGGYVYFDNSVTKWTYSHIYMIIGKDSWSSVYEMEAFPGTDYYAVELPSSGWNDATYIAVGGTNSTESDGGWSNVSEKFPGYSAKVSQSGGLAWGCYLFTPSQKANDWTFTPSTSFTFTRCPEGVLDGTKFMVYGGEHGNWVWTKYYFMNSKSTSDVATKAYKATSATINISSTDQTFWFGPVVLSANDYWQGHWASNLHYSLTKASHAGHAFIVYTKDKATDIGTALATDGDNSLYDVSKINDAAVTSISTTIGASSFYKGTSTLSVSSGDAGKSVMNRDNAIQYYLHNGNTSSWSQVTLSEGNLDVSSLTAGHYKLATVLFDDYIYVKADEDEFDVYDTWAMYSGDTKIADFTTTDGVHYSITDLVINNDNNANTNYRSSCNANPAQAGADPLLVNEASARTLIFDNGRIDWKDGNGTFNIYIVNNGGWKIYASKTAGVEEWYWIAGNGAHTGSEDVTKQLMDATAVSGVYSCTRTLTQNQTFHFGNTIKGYGPNSTARGGNTSVSVTPTSSNIGLEEYGSVYWFQFTPADQPVVMTLNTNMDPYTISFSNPVYTITYQDQGGSAYSGSNGSALPTSHTYGTATDLVNGTKDGYAFRGWFTTSACTGEAVTSLGATAYSNDITLYAKWGENPSLTGLVLSTSLVTTGNTFTATPTIDAGDGRTTIVCWEVQTAAGVKLDPQPSISPAEGNAVTITAPATPGSYKVVATLREGSVCNSGTVLDTEEQSFTVEGIYTVTITDGTGSSSVNAGSATHPSITASTVFGATFDHWEVDGGADVASKTSSTTTVSATSAGTVTAVYVQSLYAYVEGRFHIADASHSSWTNSFCSGDWDDDCTNIQFDYDETNHRFFLHTYATPKELTTSISDNTPYFFIRTSTSNSSVTGGNAYHPDPDNANKEITATGSSNGQALQTSTGTYNVYINNTSDNSYYVTLYFDGTKVWYEYMPAVINNVGLSVSRVPPTAPITATPNMYYKGATNKAYCWGVYTDEGCTSKVNSVTFSSLGDGKVQFMAPQEQGTYYLKLTVHSTDDCNATIDDEKVVSFTVTTDDMVFFKNVPGWGNVHVYFLGTSDYWDANLGSGCAGRDNGIAHGMTRIGNSDVYYYDYHGNSNVVFDGDGKAYIAFTDNYKPNSNNFSECQAVYRGDFSECAAMYVPENWITHYLNNAAYYNRGYWTNYMSAGSGFTLHVYDSKTKDAGTEIFYHEMEGTVGNNTYTFTYDFADASQLPPYTYGFEVSGCGGSWYAVEADMDITNCTDWNIYTGSSRRGGIAVDGKLEHTFILTLTGDGHIQLSVEYPLAEGDYRLLYDDETQKPHPSQYIRARANGKDTVSMFIRPSTDEALLKVQKCTDLDPITWEDYDWKTDVDTIYIAGKADGVYNFYLEQDGSKNLTVKTSATEPYSGKYYIRTSVVDGGWTSYKTSDDNLMTYAQYPEDKGYGFNYYKAKWVGSTGTDVTYTIACDYSPSLSDTLTADPSNNPLSASEAASLPHTANIRFGWHSKTNNLKREYINGSTNISDRFLVMMGDAKLKDKDGNALAISGLNANEISFTDLNNWIYRCDVTAVEGAAVKLQATYDGHEQYFIGGADKTEEIIGGSGEKPYVMRVTYDFKTNRLMTAWLPNGSEIESDVVLNADMMLIREGQNAATQVYFNGNSHSISNIHTIYGVMEFKYDHMVGKFPNWNADGAYEYLMYYISFPFDVKVSEIFGCGVRGENWIIQKYNGAKRAEIGWFKGDGTTTFWETMEGDETMNAYEGYLLLLDRVTFNDPSSSLWYKQGSGNSIYLYFPSKSVASGTISEDDKIIHVPEHTCTINRTFTVDGVAGTLNHMNTDSHWNIMGTPLFETKTASTIGTPSADGAGATTLQYYYGWNKADNTLSVRSALSTSTEFLSMHAYMVQYAGDVTFHGAKLTPPSSVAARRVPSTKNYQIELQMVNANGKSSETFVELRENACDTFALNEDMYMVRSSNMVDLYTFAGAYDVAANVLSVNNHIVPVGMDVKQAGTYRFTMPSDFSGTVTLIDTQAGVRTNLALGDYEVNLEKGTLNNRFQLEINIQASTTSLEGNDVKDGGAHKFIENGAMYILKNGEIFDVYGNHVR